MGGDVLQAGMLWEELCEAKRKIAKIECDLLIARLALRAIAYDPQIECSCGSPPYDNGNQCPKCLALSASS